MGVNKKRAIRGALARLGMHARPAQVVSALAGWGVSVSEAAVRSVVFEVLDEAAQTDRQRNMARRPRVSPPPRRFPKAPPPRGRRR
jgi:hypothetical protein